MESIKRYIVSFIIMSSLACLFYSPSLFGEGIKKRIDIYTEEFRFIPDYILLDVGVPVEIYLVNNGKERHEFLSTLFKEIDIEVEVDGVTIKGRIKEIEVEAGERIKIGFTPVKKASYTFICEIKEHINMNGIIEIR